MSEPIPTLEDVRVARRRIGDLLARGQSAQGFLQAASFASLQVELMRARTFLHAMPQDQPRSQSTEKEIVEYRVALLELSELLPRMHILLLAERARLRNGIEHIASAEAWLRTTRSLR